MGFLHKLWDETLAGPTPESGLGKLRKFNSMNGGVSSVPTSPSFSSSVVLPDHDQIGISRSITVPKTNPNHHLRNLTVNTGAAGSVPDSPVSSVSTLLSPGPPGGGQIQRLTLKKSSGETVDRAEPRTPTVYDWIVISCLVR